VAENTIISIMNGMTKGAASGAWAGARAAAEKLEPILKEKMKPSSNRTCVAFHSVHNALSLSSWF